MGEPLRILYAAGPGDVIGTYRHWKTGEDDPTQVSVTYSGQFYDIVRAGGHRALVVSSYGRADELRDEKIRLINRPTPYVDRRGVLYHMGQIWAALRLMWWGLTFRADAAVIVCGSAHWFPMMAFPLLGIKVVPSLHCVIWKKNRPLTRVGRIIRRLNRGFFTRTSSVILSASRDITLQLEEMTAHHHRPLLEFLPTYRPEQFGDVTEPSPQRNPFKVFFAGRIERDKGIFDLLAIAQRFAKEGRHDIEFDVCGAGSALAEIRRQVEADGLGERFRCHGHCGKPVMRQMYSRSHVVIVPTTTDFIEGFNQVVAEGVLGGRPVITSSVCPALHYVHGAVVEVPPDDVQAYGDAILKLADDLAFYESCRKACIDVQGQFYDLQRSWGAALSRVLGYIQRRDRIDAQMAATAPDPAPASSGAPMAASPAAAKSMAHMSVRAGDGV